MLYVQAADLHFQLTEADHSAGPHDQRGQPVSEETNMLSMQFHACSFYKVSDSACGGWVSLLPTSFIMDNACGPALI